MYSWLSSCIQTKELHGGNGNNGEICDMGMGLVKEREKAEIRVGHVHLKITELSSMQPIRSSVTHLAIQRKQCPTHL